MDGARPVAVVDETRSTPEPSAALDRLRASALLAELERETVVDKCGERRLNASIIRDDEIGALSDERRIHVARKHA